MRFRRKKTHFDLFSDLFFGSMDSNFLSDDFLNFEKQTSENEGTLEVTTGENENVTWEKKEWVSADGKSKMTSYVMKNSPKTEPNEENLRKQLKSALDVEDYELAAKIKKQIDSL